MKRKTFFAVLAAFGLALAVAALPASAQTVDDIIAKSLEARGGKAKIQAVKSAVFTGKMGMGPAGEAPVIFKWQRPNKVRLEFTFQGMTGIQAYDGTTGWMVMPFLGKKDPEKMSEDDLKDVQDMADSFEGPLVDYAAKGHKVELLGKEPIEGTEAYKIKLTKKNGDVQTIYIDAEAYLEIFTEGKRKTPNGEVEFIQSLGDYKEVGGLLFAMSMESKPKGAPQGQVITIEKVELDKEIAASDFAMPEVPAKPAEAPKPPQPIS
jgi:outer membrane lipoprotein-sorting protein